MTSDNYLKKVLDSQRLDDDSEEMNQLRKTRDEVERILKESFPTAKIRYGGSKAKGTLIKDSYDVDLVCYFPHDETEAGETLEELYRNVSRVLSRGHYQIEEKTSAIRLLSAEPDSEGTYTHVDVVPGRYTDTKISDCFLYQNGGEKGRLKTNLEVHIDHIKKSGVTDALSLLKLWRVQNSLEIKQFAFELLGVKLLKDQKNASLSKQVEHVLRAIAESEDPIIIEDPANPSGNDLMPLLNFSWSELQSVASSTIKKVERYGWEDVYGALSSYDDTDHVKQLTAAIHVAQHEQPTTKPWSE
ncbi:MULTISPECIES: nucleotidyltransferase domain-containing protein [unclassified Nitrospina]|uniref:nucleotidyltransferase domain-containing protein n=1 Tax=unclassified Nitrospina TaxID=2638683 RepID=UPI003F96BF9C